MLRCYCHIRAAVCAPITFAFPLTLTRDSETSSPAALSRLSLSQRGARLHDRLQHRRQPRTHSDAAFVGCTACVAPHTHTNIRRNAQHTHTDNTHYADIFLFYFVFIRVWGVFPRWRDDTPGCFTPDRRERFQYGLTALRPTIPGRSRSRPASRGNASCNVIVCALRAIGVVVVVSRCWCCDVGCLLRVVARAQVIYTLSPCCAIYYCPHTSLGCPCALNFQCVLNLFRSANCSSLRVS